MSQNGIKAYTKNPCGIPASRAIHSHINDGLMGFGFRPVVAIVELESLQALIAAIELRI